MKDIEAFLANPRNFAGLPAQFSDFDSARVVILPVPYDSTMEWHTGSREGPRSIIDASAYLETYDIEAHRDIHEIGIHTLPELKPTYNSPEETIQRVYKTVKSLLTESKFIVMLGGEHSITQGAVLAHKEIYKDCSVLQLDAHADLRDEYDGTKYGHASVMRRVFDICPITQVGIRSLCLEESEFITSNNIPAYCLDDPSASQLNVDEIIRSLSDNVYLSIDLDVFDPSIMSSVGTPVPGGLYWHQVIDLLRQVSRARNIIGCDIVELCPSQGNIACSFLAAKLAYKIIGYANSRQFYKSK